jgi:hypothetical protein
MAKKTTKAAKKDEASKKDDKPAHVLPAVNLSAAASSAAQLLANRKLRAAAGGDTASAGINAATFKQLTNSVNQPQHAAASPLAGLNKQTKQTGTASYNHVGGHHQNNTNVARTGVPRRTSGG